MTHTAAKELVAKTLPGGNSRLECRGLACGYGRLTVVRDIDLSLAPREVLALLGPNGAGKTTLLHTIAGLLPGKGGEVLVDDVRLPSGRPAAAVRADVALVPDDRSLFMKLSVRENLEVARRRHGPKAADMLDLFPALGARWNLSAGNLSGGEQQMLAVARALLRKPNVLLIDEMSMGLAPAIVGSLMPLVRRVADETDATVVLVEQHVSLALEVADRAMILVHGEINLTSQASDLARDPARLEAAYLGAPPQPLPDNHQQRRAE